MRFSRIFTIFLLVCVFSLLNINEVSAAPLRYKTPSCDWNVAMTQDNKAKASCTLSISAYAIGEMTLGEFATAVGLELAGGAISIGGLLLGGTLIAASGEALFISTQAGYTIIPLAGYLLPSGTIMTFTTTLGPAALLAVQQAANIAGITLAVGTAASQTGQGGELGPVELIAYYKIADNQGTQALSLTDGARVEFPEGGAVFDPKQTYKFHVYLRRTGGEKTYKPADYTNNPFAFAEEQNEWNLYYDWNPSSEARQLELCAGSQLTLSLEKWDNVQTAVFKITSSEYCVGQSVGIAYDCKIRKSVITGITGYGCNGLSTTVTLDSNGEATFSIEGSLENNTEAYAVMNIVLSNYHSVKVQSNKVTVILPPAYIFKDERGEGTEFRLSPSPVTTGYNYPRHCEDWWEGDHPDWNITRIEIYDLSGGWQIGNSISAYVYDKGELKCSGASRTIPCTPFECYDNIIVNTDDYEYVGSSVDWSFDPPWVRVLYILMKKKVSGNPYYIWVRGRGGGGGDCDNGLAGATVTIIPTEGQIKDKFGTITAVTDSGGMATFTAANGKANVVIVAPGYKTLTSEMNLFYWPSEPPSIDSTFCLEKGESTGCVVTANKQFVKMDETVSVNVYCSGTETNCKDSYTIDCGNGQTTTARYCGYGLCGESGSCTYTQNDIKPDGKSAVGKTFTISTEGDCVPTSVIAESTKPRFIQSVSPVGLTLLSKRDVEFSVKTSEEATCAFSPSSSTLILAGIGLAGIRGVGLAGIRSSAGTSKNGCSYSGDFNSNDGITHTYTLPAQCLVHDGSWSFTVICYKKSDNSQDTGEISFSVNAYIMDYAKTLRTDITMPICVVDEEGDPVKGAIVLINVVGLDYSKGQYYNAAPVVTGDDGCANIWFAAPKYLDGGFKIRACLGAPKSSTGYSSDQCGEATWSYPPRPLTIVGSLNTVKKVEFKNCDEKRLEISFNPAGPFSVLGCNRYSSFNTGVEIKGICKIGNKEYSEPYALADVRGAIVQSNEDCPSSGQNVQLLLSGITTQCPMDQYIGSFATPCETGDYKICIAATDTLGIYQPDMISTSLHIGELTGCAITLNARCQITTRGLSLVTASVNMDNCAFSYKLNVRHKTPGIEAVTGGAIVDYCSFETSGGTRTVIDRCTGSSFVFPGAYSEKFSCNGEIPGNDKQTFLLMDTSAEDYTLWKTLASLTLNCTAGETGETSWSPS